MSSFSVGLEIACLLALGVLARKLKLVKAEFAGDLSRVVLNFSLPCSIVTALMKPISDEQLNGIPMMLVCVGIYLLAAFLLSKLFSKKHDDYTTIMTAGTFFPNFTFMGYPVIESFYGSEGILNLSILSIPVRILLYAMLPIQFSKDKSKKFSLSSLKALLIPAVIAIPVGAALGLMEIQLPAWLSNALTSVASTSTPLGMMICGLLIAEVKIKDLITDKHVRIVALIRLILLPALTLAGLYFLPIPKITRDVMVTFAALPTASIITAYAASNDVNPRQAAMTVTFSTVVSIFTLPVWAWILTVI